MKFKVKCNYTAHLTKTGHDKKPAQDKTKITCHWKEPGTSQECNKNFSSIKVRKLREIPSGKTYKKPIKTNPTFQLKSNNSESFEKKTLKVVLLPG